MLIWVIDSGLPGVTNQCLGVARAIATLGPCRIERVSVRLRTHLLQPLLRKALQRGLLNGFPERRPARWLAGLIFSGLSSKAAKPDLTVSALGRSEIAAVFLRNTLGTVAVHIGLPSRMPSETFDLIVLQPVEAGDAVSCASVSLDLVPTPILLSNLAGRTGEPVSGWRQRKPRLWAVLVGGNGAGFSYTQPDWEKLAGSLRELAERHGAGLLLSTSRRTGAAAEAVLKAALGPGAPVIDAVWYVEHPRPVVADYLASAELVFCTEDSGSMISDAVAAGKPVYAVRPESGMAEDRLARYLALQEGEGRISRVDIGKLADIEIAADVGSHFRPLIECWSVKLLDAIRPLVSDLLADLVNGKK